MNARIGHYIPGVSWDVCIMRLLPETSATDEIPEDWDLPMPGHWPDIRTARCELFLHSRGGLPGRSSGWTPGRPGRCRNENQDRPSG